MGSNPSDFKACGNNCPVENVNWDDVQIFIQKLNTKTGQHFRLPTEAEWEYACRAGQSHLYCGNEKIGEVAWYWENSGNFLNSQQIHPVAQKQANAYGLYDMSGNVWEWVQDSYRSQNGGAKSDEDWRIKRGGSWFYMATDARAAKRAIDKKTRRYFDIGFRLARTLP